MSGPIPEKVFLCPTHGWSNRSFCVACRARDYKARQQKGLIVNKLKEGKGQQPDDLSPLQIKYRSLIERKNRG